MPQTRERTNNTRAQRKPRPAAPKAQPQIVPFAYHCDTPTEDRFLMKMPVPVTCMIETVHIYAGAVTPGEGKSTARIQLGMDSTEYIEREIEQGDNEFQVHRVFPAHQRITVRIVDGSVTNFWFSGHGIATSRGSE